MSDSADLSGRYRAILFDLFGTLVHFRRIPLVNAGTGAIHPRLAAAVEEELPGLSLAEFVEHVRHVSRDLDHARRQTHREFSSHERFRRVLERLGSVDDARALRLCEAHMGGLAEATEMPEAHIELLRRLRSRHEVGLISNFDHGPTARGILERHGLAGLLDPVLISDECGWRKPGTDIFLLALDALGVDPRQALFVGDTPLDDVEGARRAGLDAVWINAGGGVFPADLPPPAFTITRVIDLGRRLLP